MGSKRAIGKHHTSPDLNLSDLSAVATQRASACRARAIQPEEHNESA
jgi:hypothetical protein